MGLTAWCLRFDVEESGFRVWGSGFRVQGSGFRLHGSGLGIQGPGFRVERADRHLWDGLEQCPRLPPLSAERVNIDPDFACSDACCYFREEERRVRVN